MSQDAIERLILMVVYLIPLGLLIAHFWEFTQGEDEQDEGDKK